MKIIRFSALALLMAACPVFASAQIVAANTKCLNESATVTVRFNDTDSDVAVIKDHFDKEVAEIKKLAKGMSLEKFELQNMNYNINPQNMYGGRRYNQQNNPEQYTLNGSASFTVLPAGKAIDVMAALTRKGYSASMNSNVWNNGCNNPVMYNTIAPPPPPPVAAPVVHSH